jgi:hypothetical protein
MTHVTRTFLAVHFLSQQSPAMPDDAHLPAASSPPLCFASSSSAPPRSASLSRPHVNPSVLRHRRCSSPPQGWAMHGEIDHPGTSNPCSAPLRPALGTSAPYDQHYAWLTPRTAPTYTTHVACAVRVREPTNGRWPRTRTLRSSQRGLLDAAQRSGAPAQHFVHSTQLAPQQAGIPARRSVVLRGAVAVGKADGDASNGAAAHRGPLEELPV